MNRRAFFLYPLKTPHSADLGRSVERNDIKRIVATMPHMYNNDPSSSSEEEEFENEYVHKFMKLAAHADCHYKATQESFGARKIPIMEQLECKVAVRHALLEFAKIPADVRCSEEIEKLTRPLLTKLQEYEKKLEFPTDDEPERAPKNEDVKEDEQKLGEGGADAEKRRGTEKEGGETARKEEAETARTEGSDTTRKKEAETVREKEDQEYVREAEHENEAVMNFIKKFDEVRRAYYQKVFALGECEDMALRDIIGLSKRFSEARSLYHLIPEKVRKELRTRCTADRAYTEIGKYLYNLRLFYGTKMEKEYA